MSLTELTPEQRRALEPAGAAPVRIDDPELREAVYLVRQRVWDQWTKAANEPEPPAENEAPFPRGIPEGIRKSQEAFFRDLPNLLAQPRLRGRYVAYHGDERIGIARDDEPLLRACVQSGLRRDEYDIFVIEPQSPEPEEVEIFSAGLL